MVDINDVTSTFYKIVLSEEEISLLDEMNNGDGLNFNLEHLYLMKVQIITGRRRDSTAE